MIFARPAAHIQSDTTRCLTALPSRLPLGGPLCPVRFILAPCHQILSVRPVDNKLDSVALSRRKTSLRGLGGTFPATATSSRPWKL
jgi:hypothetical protein